MPAGLTVTKNIHFSKAEKGRREIRPGPSPIRDGAEGRVPRVSRLMALAIKFDGLLAAGAVRDQAELAELGHIKCNRIINIAREYKRNHFRRMFESILFFWTYKINPI